MLSRKANEVLASSLVLFPLRDERSRGIEILMTDAFAKFKPTEPFRLVKQVV